jgi:hypothetical protein
MPNHHHYHHLLLLLLLLLPLHDCYMNAAAAAARNLGTPLSLD